MNRNGMLGMMGFVCILSTEIYGSSSLSVTLINEQDLNKIQTQCIAGGTVDSTGSLSEYGVNHIVNWMNNNVFTQKAIASMDDFNKTKNNVDKMLSDVVMHFFQMLGMFCSKIENKTWITFPSGVDGSVSFNLFIETIIISQQLLEAQKSFVSVLNDMIKNAMNSSDKSKATLSRYSSHIGSLFQKGIDLGLQMKGSIDEYFENQFALLSKPQ